MHLVMATCEDSHLPLSRLRTRDQLIELRDLLQSSDRLEEKRWGASRTCRGNSVC